MTALTESIGALVEPLVRAAGLELWDVEQAPEVLRVLVDRAGGIDLDGLGAVAQTISDAVDARPDLVPDGRYQLEVSSPGVERTLRTPAHYQRFTGTLVSVKTTEPIDGSRRLQGTLQAADGDGIRLAGEGESGWDLSYRQIQKARTVLVWGPAPKPGASRSRARVGASQAVGRPNPPSMKDTAP